MTANDIETSGKKIPTLSKDNYLQWRRSIKCELTLRELWECIEPDPASGLVGQTTLRKKEAKAQAFILIHIEERYQAMVEDMDSAKEIWTFLERLFKARSKDRAVDLWREFFTTKQQAMELAMEFVARVETRGRELRDACKQVVSDEMMTGIIVEGVLPAYHQVVEALRISKKLTVEALKEELTTADNRLDKVQRQDAELLAASAQPKPASDAEPRRETRECYYCGRKGHVRSECRKLKRDERAGQVSSSHTPATSKTDSQQRGEMMLLTAMCNVQQSNRMVNEDVVLFDTGATHHMVSSRKYFSDMQYPSVCTVICGGGEEHAVLGTGSVTLQTAFGPLGMTNVLFVPTLSTNVMSGLTALDRGFSWSGHGDTVQLTKNGRVCVMAKRLNGLLAVDGTLTVTQSQCYSVNATECDAALWHRRLAHPADGALNRTLKQYRKDVHIILDGSHSRDCDACLKAKQPRQSYPPSMSQASAPLELVHADIMMMNVTGITGCRYALVLMDDFSRFGAVAVLQYKHQVAAKTLEIIRAWQRQTGCKLKTFRSDNGTEFKGELDDVFVRTGVQRQFSVQYTPQQNGRVERLNRTLAEKMRALLFDSGLPEKFWECALLTANAVRNKTFSSVVRTAPEQLFTGKPVDLTHLRVFGCLAYAHVPKELRKKLSARSQPGVFVGYDDCSKAWRLAILRNGHWRTTLSHDVHFLEDKRGFAMLKQHLEGLSHTSFPPCTASAGTGVDHATQETTQEMPFARTVDNEVLGAADPATQPARQIDDETAVPVHDHAPADVEMRDRDSQEYGTDNLELSDAEDAPKNASEGAATEPTPAGPAQWHVNSAQDILEDNAQAHAGRPKRVRRARFDEYVDRFVENRSFPNRAGHAAAATGEPWLPDATGITSNTEADQAPAAADPQPEDLIDVLVPAIELPHSTRLRSLRDLAGQLHRLATLPHLGEFTRGCAHAPMDAHAQPSVQPKCSTAIYKTPKYHGDSEERTEANLNMVRQSYSKVKIPQLTSSTKDMTQLTDEPRTLTEVKQRPDWEQWKEAMCEEMSNLAEKQVYEEVELPIGKQAIPSKWVFKLKRQITGQIDKYRSRLVALGFRQKAGLDYDEIFAPTSSTTALRILLSWATQHDLEIEHLDVRAAFMNGELVEEVYMKCPPGFETPGKVWRLKRAINGLKQAALAWYAKMTTSLKQQGFKVSDTDPCLYTKTKDGRRLFIIVHVDDLLVIGTKSDVEDAKRTIKALFDVKDMGAAQVFIGLEIRRDRENKALWLGQTAYIAATLQTYGMGTANSRVAPLDAGTRLDATGIQYEDATRYRALVGTLLYMSTKTRPDIAHAVGMLSRYMNAPTKQHWDASKQVLRYLKGTQDLGLVYQQSVSGPAYGYSDADYAGDVADRKSTSAHVFMFGGAAVSWLSKLQSTVATSTCEAEFVAGAAAVKESLYISKLFVDITGTWKPLQVLCDNQSALQVLKTPEIEAQTRLKHVDIAYKFARNRVTRGDVQVGYIPTKDMVADALTKQLPGPGHTSHRNNMGIDKLPV